MKGIWKNPYLVGFKEIQDFFLIIVKLNFRKGFEIGWDLFFEILFKDDSPERLRYEYPVYGKDIFIHLLYFKKKQDPRRLTPGNQEAALA